MNERLIARYGGARPAVQNGASLRYALDAIRGTVFGVDRYPTLEEKACALAYAIAQEHVFRDGNKKTATEVLYQTLELNGRTVLASEDESVDIMEDVARGNVPFQDLLAWVRNHLR